MATSVREGANENIDDDVRARALKFVQDGGKSESAPKPAAKAAAKSAAKPAPKQAAKPAATAEDNSVPPPAKTLGKSLVDQIPKPEPRANPGTPMEESSETGRNLKNLAAAAAAVPVIGGAAKLGQMGMKALQSARAAKAAPAVEKAVEKSAPLAARTKELVMSDRVGPKASAWASRGSANADMAAKRAAASKGRPAPKTKSDAVKAKSRFKEDEAGVEFKRGGAVKRGWGIARGR